jgi:hypothetical protein
VLGGIGELENFQRNITGSERNISAIKNVIIVAIGMEMQVFCDRLAAVSGATEIVYFEETG